MDRGEEGLQYGPSFIEFGGGEKIVWYPLMEIHEHTTIHQVQYGGEKATNNHQ